ncbi:hypothetical protein J2Y69_001906 [Microbacterium resistens]|uniref:SseB protein N-terminal domain-containing protein n=1 Tax=Microbacterium resistens TaxID=156977 RepID=A0ABU1SCG7_9MICO|nr:SseB family protein [Microbacterium resistens]MDR6867305.1 hypothetical protein [Microbacterium resistens]
MGLFSRRKKQDDAVSTPSRGAGDEVDAQAPSADASAVDAAAVDAAVAEVPVAEVPAVNVDISVQAFRGLGAPAGPDVAAPGQGADEDAQARAEESPTAPASEPSPNAVPTAPSRPTLPLAPADPPAQTESIPGMTDNVLLREALSQIEEGASHTELLGVLRQALQGHLFLRVQGDAGEQLKEGKPLAVGVVNDGENSYMLAFSSAGAVRDSVQLESDAPPTSAVVQPVQAVFQQVAEGPFAGLIIDNASAPHRVVFPTAVLVQALEQADPSFAVKALLAAERSADSEAKVGEALVTARLWVAVRAPEGEDGQMGVAEAQMADGTRFLQLFSHPLEVIALGRGEQPLPFSGEQIGKVLAGHPELAGVLVDPAGPTIAVRREALAPVLALAAE